MRLAGRCAKTARAVGGAAVGLQFAFLTPAVALMLVSVFDASTGRVGMVLAIYNASGSLRPESPAVVAVTEIGDNDALTTFRSIRCGEPLASERSKPQIRPLQEVRAH